MYNIAFVVYGMALSYICASHIHGRLNEKLKTKAVFILKYKYNLFFIKYLKN
jgi:hypothetical protein